MTDQVLIEGDNKNGRVSISAFYSDADPKSQARMVKLNFRTEAMNGKKMSSEDEIQIANYGIGGHYFLIMIQIWKTQIQDLQLGWDTYQMLNKVVPLFFFTLSLQSIQARFHWKFSKTIYGFLEKYSGNF